MKPLSLLSLVYGTLLLPFFLLAACHSSPSSTSVALSARDSSTIDSARSTDAPAIAPALETRDSTRLPNEENYDTLDPATRSHFRDVQAFLDFIRRPNDDNGQGFGEWIRHFRVTNIDSFLSFIPADSLEIDDADEGPGYRKYSRALVRQQLTRRKGPVFNMIGVISLQFSDPYPQYSHTIYSTDKKDSVPNLQVSFSEFILYFRAEKDSAAYKLYRLESDHISDQ